MIFQESRQETFAPSQEAYQSITRGNYSDKKRKSLEQGFQTQSSIVRSWSCDRRLFLRRLLVYAPVWVHAVCTQEDHIGLPISSNKMSVLNRARNIFSESNKWYTTTCLDSKRQEKTRNNQWRGKSNETRCKESLDEALTTKRAFGGEIHRIRREENKSLISGESGKDREQAHRVDAANPAGTIRHDRQSVVWLVEPAWKAIVTLLWVARRPSLPLSLSLFRGSPIDIVTCETKRRRGERTEGDGERRMEDTRGETEIVIIT